MVNNALASKLVNNTLVGQQTLANTDPSSGGTVTNIQRELNSLASYTGKATNVAASAFPSWSSNVVGASTDSLFDRTDAIDGLFDEVTGHGHTGAAGDGVPISALDLTNFNPYFQAIQVVNVPGWASASSVVVTTEFSGKSELGTSNSIGVLTIRSGITTESDSNMVRLRQNKAPIFDSNGDEIYGWIHFASSVWTLKLYAFDGTNQNPAFFASDDPVQLYYREVFTGSRPTVSPLLEFGLFGGAGGAGGAGGGLMTENTFSGTTITLTDDARQSWRSTATAAITVGTIVTSALVGGEDIEVVCYSNSAPVTINESAAGVIYQNGNITLNQYESIQYRFDSAASGLREIGRTP